MTTTLVDALRPLWYLDRDALLALAPAPESAVAHGRGTDIDGDLDVLYVVTKLLQRQAWARGTEISVVELGTRQGVSTKTLHDAINWREYQTERPMPEINRPSPTLWTIDPDPHCRAYLQALKIDQHADFICSLGETVFAHRGFIVPNGGVDVLFVDTDPHTYDQTKLWLDTWVQRVKPGGVAAFHDIVPARPEIQVADAVRAFVSAPESDHTEEDRGRGRVRRSRQHRLFDDGREDRETDLWVWREYPSDRPGAYGIGLLWRKA